MQSVQATLSNLDIDLTARVVQSDPIIQQATMIFEEGLIGSISKSGGMNVILACENANITIRSDGLGISLATPTAPDPYFAYPEKFILDKSKKLEGTLAAIKILVDGMKNESLHTKSFRLFRRNIFIYKAISNVFINKFNIFK